MDNQSKEQKGNTMKTTLRLSLAFTALFVLAAFAGFGKDRGKALMHEHGLFGIENLTDAQKKQIQDIRQEMEKASIPLKAQVELKHAELKTLLVAEKPDKTAIDKKIEEIGAIRVQLQKKWIGSGIEISALLTPEQRAKFDEHILQFGRGGMMDGFEGPGMEPRMERMFRMRKEMPPECPMPPGHMQEKEEVEIEHK
jgi:Spy/CpxP family protein refolding chaperone